MTRLLAAVLSAAFLSACASEIERLGEVRTEISRTRLAVDRERLEAATALFCGAGLDAHIQAAARRSDHGTTAATLCGPMARELVTPASE